MTTECRVEGCTNPVKVKSRQLCGNHYEKGKRWGFDADLTLDRRGETLHGPRPRAVHEKKCAMCQEVLPRERFYVKKESGLLSGYCKECQKERYRAVREKERAEREEWRKKNPPNYLKDCTFEGCLNKIASKGLCQGHYNQRYKGQELKPLRYMGHAIVDENHRRCTGCREVKTKDEFYIRQTGIPQSRCKRCMVLSNRYDKLVRQGRLEEATSLAETFPEHLRNRYLGESAQTND